MIKLPPLPDTDCQGIHFDGYSPETLRARDLEVAKAVLEAAAVVAEKYFHTTTAKVIRALEVSHD